MSQDCWPITAVDTVVNHLDQRSDIPAWVTSGMPEYLKDLAVSIWKSAYYQGAIDAFNELRHVPED